MTAAGLVFVYVPLTRDGEFIEFNCTGREREGGREREEGEREREREREINTESCTVLRSHTNSLTGIENYSIFTFLAYCWIIFHKH